MFEALLTLECPLTKRKVDTSKSAYADDLSNKIIVQGLCPDQVKAMITSSNNVLDNELRPTSIGQNVSKQEICISCFGKHARNIANCERVSQRGTYYQ